MGISEYSSIVNECRKKRKKEKRMQYDWANNQCYAPWWLDPCFKSSGSNPSSFYSFKEISEFKKPSIYSTAETSRKDPRFLAHAAITLSKSKNLTKKKRGAFHTRKINYQNPRAKSCSPSSTAALNYLQKGPKMTNYDSLHLNWGAQVVREDWFPRSGKRVMFWEGFTSKADLKSCGLRWKRPRFNLLQSFERGIKWALRLSLN